MTTLLNKVLDRQNMYQAIKSVCSNKGTNSIDGITIDEIDEYIRENWKRIKVEIKERRYKPQPVLRVEIPKPNGSIRKLRIPTVMDRIIQQAMAQVLSPIADKEFSEFIYGFRPGRNTHGALKRCQEYINEGYNWVVDIDLASYFDTVNHDKLIDLIHKEVKDIRIISLIRKYLNAGAIINGVVSPTKLGAPQGGLCRARHKPPYVELDVMPRCSLSA